ncbi:hypothetical protein [Rheinheimera pacifica]
MKHNKKYRVKLDGKMNEIDAGRVGNKLANANMLFGAAALLAAVSLWF